MQRYVSATLEVSTRFLLRENPTHETGGQRDGRTDGRGATSNAAVTEGPIKTELVRISLLIAIKK